jgi:hypothetical protein
MTGRGGALRAFNKCSKTKGLIMNRDGNPIDNIIEDRRKIIVPEDEAPTTEATGITENRTKYRP